MSEATTKFSRCAGQRVGGRNMKTIPTWFSATLVKEWGRGAETWKPFLLSSVQQNSTLLAAVGVKIKCFLPVLDSKSYRENRHWFIDWCMHSSTMFIRIILSSESVQNQVWSLLFWSTESSGWERWHHRMYYGWITANRRSDWKQGIHHVGFLMCSWSNAWQAEALPPYPNEGFRACQQCPFIVCLREWEGWKMSFVVLSVWLEHNSSGLDFHSNLGR